jgi:hypothetical protein
MARRKQTTMSTERGASIEVTRETKEYTHRTGVVFDQDFMRLTVRDGDREITVYLLPGEARELARLVRM